MVVGVGHPAFCAINILPENRYRKMALTASAVAAKLNLKPHPEGGFFSETFRDTSITLSTSQLPPECK